MVLFGRKKEEPKITQVEFTYPEIDKGEEEVKRLRERIEKVSEPVILEKPKEEKVTPKVEVPIEIKIKPEKVELKEEEKPVFAPLFVKLDRYRKILNTIAQLKTTLLMVKNSFIALNELEKVRIENMKLIQEALNKVEKRILDLDTELIRPSGLHEEIPEYGDVQAISATIADLKGQIEQLKAELETIS